MGEGKSAPPEQLLDIAVCEFHPGRAAVVALARMRGRLHLAEQRVHLGDRQHAPRPHRTVARHRRGDVIEPFLEAERGVIGAERSEEHTSELQSLMRISYAGFCLKNKSILTN